MSIFDRHAGVTYGVVGGRAVGGATARRVVALQRQAEVLSQLCTILQQKKLNK